MDKFFSNLTGGGDKNKSSNDNNQRKKDDGTSWQGGRSGGMESIRNSRNVALRVGSGRVGGGSSGSSGGNANGNRPSNIFANAGAGINEALGKIDLFNQNKKNEAKARGGGQSLGGSLPGRVFSVCLDQPGHLGMEVERRKNSQGTTIISRVVPGSQAATAGLQRGDIVCHAGTNGSKEIPYDEILAMARSGRRPLKFDVRRIESNLGGGSNSTISGGVRVSADAEARKQAMIAAAEAREAKHKAKTKPVPRTASTEKIYLKGKQNDATRQQPQYEVNESEETKRAIAAVKKAEQDDAENLGYNPYEAKAMTGGQARTATVAMTRGEINVGNAPQKLVGGDVSAPGRVSAPKDPTEEVSDARDVPIEFEHAFTTLVTSDDNNNAVVKSMGIMRKLIINATTKGQEGNLDDENSSKFRRVRLSNPKIKEAVADLLGGLELMMIVGFQLIDNEDDGETYLVFPPGEKGPKWLGDALARMESYENGGF